MEHSSDNTTDTPTEIVNATYRVLAREGYAGLTTQKIADECDKSQGVVHYHYTTKEELLTGVIESLLEERADQLAAIPEEGTLDRLDAFFDCVLPTPDSVSRRAAVTLAVHAQAPYNSTYRAHLEERDQLLHETLAAIIDDGINRSIFHAVDTQQTADAMLSMIDGSLFRAVSLGNEDVIWHARDSLDQFIQSELLVENGLVNR